MTEISIEQNGDELIIKNIHLNDHDEPLILNLSDINGFLGRVDVRWVKYDSYEGKVYKGVQYLAGERAGKRYDTECAVDVYDVDNREWKSAKPIQSGTVDGLADDFGGKVLWESDEELRTI